MTLGNFIRFQLGVQLTDCCYRVPLLENFIDVRQARKLIEVQGKSTASTAALLGLAQFHIRLVFFVDPHLGFVDLLFALSSNTESLSFALHYIACEDSANKVPEAAWAVSTSCLGACLHTIPDFVTIGALLDEVANILFLPFLRLFPKESIASIPGGLSSEIFRGIQNNLLEFIEDSVVVRVVDLLLCSFDECFQFVLKFVLEAQSQILDDGFTLIIIRQFFHEGGVDFFDVLDFSKTLLLLLLEDPVQAADAEILQKLFFADSDRDLLVVAADSA